MYSAGYAVTALELLVRDMNVMISEGLDVPHDGLRDGGVIVLADEAVTGVPGKLALPASLATSSRMTAIPA